MLTRQNVAQMIDHTLLKPEATHEDVTKLIDEASHLGTFSVCVSPSMLPIETPADLKVAVVCGFPSGAVPTEAKAADAAHSVANGADEVDMVINLGAAKEGKWDVVRDDIAAVKKACGDKLLKVIIESAVLTDDEIVAACKASMEAGADFVKTSTGFHPAGGASAHAVKLMRETVGDKLGVKASGGIRDAATAKEMIEAGASRLGLSSSAAVLEGWN
ncbi:deoxyribose-phosphate aldolase [Corynebacterium sp. NML98-0116]|uniref:Deoxyribose-phosphate aldolase n=1 Tax=Corynebacterium lipophilum TaxID=2804918 RepID=A0AAW5HW91_9CORY|nr:MULTISPECIES: deoxyribose-phosphate aldolase [Corynebacterium]AOX05140.1 deoxyribose-phosphate aldolase [Corynebacterium sp. NML98-0116]MCO6394508.1 deoxyribose-phosphate aldolase [Corynebacterium lipophilum]MCZ2117506.1 deoxyribose-phosphate aldolase [Corynebacterium lipophilum]